MIKNTGLYCSRKPAELDSTSLYLCFLSLTLKNYIHVVAKELNSLMYHQCELKKIKYLFGSLVCPEVEIWGLNRKG